MTDPSDDSAAGEDAPLTRAASRRSPETPSAFQEHVRAARSEFEQQIDRARADFEQVNDRINERSGRNLLLAIVIGVAVGAAVVASLILVKWLFLFFAIPVGLLGAFEFSRALQTSGRRVDVVPQLVAGGILMLAAFFGDPLVHWTTTFACVVFVIVWRLMAQMAASDGRGYVDVLADVLVAAFVLLYVSFLASLTLVLLRQEQGEYWLLAMVVAVVAADTGAYASGLAFGSHPMAPRISPKKTWEGFAGGALATVVVGILFGIFVLHIPWWAGIVFGVVILGSATVGDLGESMIKRDLGIKDMSSWLPGHGGVLDRLDSMLPSAAAALAMYFLLFPLVST